MIVKEFTTSNCTTRFVVIDDNGNFIKPLNKFLKFKDNSNSARSTIRSYAYSLSLYFDFLKQKKLSYSNVGIDEFAEYIRWLQSPYKKVNIHSIDKQKKVRKIRTINTYLNHVYNFYDYILRHEDYSIKLSNKLKKQFYNNHSGFKSFLYHIKRSNVQEKNLLKLKEPKEKIKTLSKDEVETLINSCNNIRDKFLVLLLYETGMRIGEALSLHLHDIVPVRKKISIKNRGELENGASIKTISSPRVLDIPKNLANLYRSYILHVHTEDVDTDFVFIKLTGPNRYEPLDYVSAQKIFSRLQKRTGIRVTSHMFRHTNLTELWKTGKMRAETLKERAGHAHIQTTMQMYIHPTEEDIRIDWESAINGKALRKE
ncbi:tyrosine-type recombinase/integrase [Staphylococcus equorum]|uniref:tyrosine-type recombinase/integrase n=1 Tax=Staphylococcus equorum TaxID=246432 RepID=UPI003EBD4D9A